MEPDSHRIDELFRQRMAPLRVSPPPMAWDRLSDALDQVADAGIPAKGLSPAGSTASGLPRKSWTGIAVAGLLFFSLFLTPERIGYTAVHQQLVSGNLNNYSNQENEVGTASASLVNLPIAALGQAEKPANTPVSSEFSAPQENLVPGTSSSAEHQGMVTAAATPSALTTESALEQLTTSALSPAATTTAAATAASASTPDNPITSTIAAAATSTSAATITPATRTQGPSPWTNFYGGLHGSLQWTGLLSQNNAQPDENLNPLLNIGYAFGLHAGYRFNARISLETGLVLNSMQGSRYESSVDTRNVEVPVTKSLMLHYTQLPLTVRVSPGRNNQGHMPEGWSYVGGLQYGMLRTSKLRIEDKPVNPERNLQEHDIAVLLGMDYDLPLNDQLFVTLGFRGSLGLNQANVTTVEGINSDKRNAVLGFRAAFNGFLLPQ